MLVGFAKDGWDECAKAVDVHTLGRARRDLRQAAKKDGLPTMVIMSHGLYLLPE